jgi:hypothetical protein
LRVADVQAYLLRRGWKSVPPDRPGTLVFQEPPGAAGGQLYQLVPDSKSDPDYFRRMVELITLLAFFEDRHPAQIIDEIVGGAGTDGADGTPK